jgi:hypothetical protein
MYLSNLKPGQARKQHTFLHKSNVDGEFSCTPSTGAVFSSPENPFSENYSVQMVVQAVLTFTLDLEGGMLDSMHERLMIPRLGITLNLNGKEEISDINHEHGSIYYKQDTTNNTCEQHEMVEQNATGILYRDKTPGDKNNTHQDVLVIKLEEIEKQVKTQRSVARYASSPRSPMW